MPDCDVRLATPDDAPPIQAIYEPIVRETTISFEIDPPGLAEMRRRIEAAGERYPWLVCTVDDEIAGFAFATQFKERAAYARTASVSIYTASAWRRWGFGRRLYGALLGFLELQRFHLAVATIALPNEASAALHRAVGFRHAGTLSQVGWKFGRWIDVDLWQRTLPDGEGGQETLTVTEIAGTARWQELRSRAGASHPAGH